MADDVKDNRGPAVIVIGSVIGGFKVYGPFDTVDDAVDELTKLAVPQFGSIDILHPASELPLRKKEA